MSKKSNVQFVFCIIFSIMLLINPQEVVFLCKKGMSLAFSTAAPGLFIYIFSAMLIAEKSKLLCFDGKISAFFGRLLSLSPKLLPIIVTCMFSGAPSGAFAIAELYGNGEISKADAEKSAVLCNNCSMGFIMGVVSACAGSNFTALIIAFSSYLSVLIVYFAMFGIQKNNNKGVHTENKKQSNTQGKTLSDIIQQSFTNVITICGYITFFHVISNMLNNRICFLFNSNGLQNIARAIISLFFEISSGCAASTVLENDLKILFISFGVSFTGVSIIMQVKGTLEKSGISAESFIFSKVAAGILCPVITFAFLHIFPQEHYSLGADFYGTALIPGINKSLMLCLAVQIPLLISMFLIYIGKKHKNNC